MSGNENALTSDHIDCLREIGNIGSGHAASSLAQLLNRRVDMQPPTVSVLDIEALADKLGGPENQIIGILFTLAGDFQGMMMFLTEQKFAHLSLNVLMGKELKGFEDLTEIDLSALMEVGNIMISAYITAISDLTRLSITLSPPSIAIDMAGAILSVPALEIEKIGDKALFIQDGFIDEKERVTSYLLLIPEEGHLQNMLRVLGMEI